VVGPVVEEAVEPEDVTSLTGPPRESSITRVQPPPPRITSLSPPRPPSRQPLVESQARVQPQRRLGKEAKDREPREPGESKPSRDSREPRVQNENMGTVLSFSPRERHGSVLASSPPTHPTAGANFTLNNFNYEQLNNAKNRENKSVLATVAATQPSNHPPTNNNSIQNNNVNVNNNDNARIISEKNALEKNLKKNSLIIGALSWKRFSTINNNKKKLDNKNKNIKFRQPLDNIAITDKNKNIQTPQVSRLLLG
jgi:hypothetical protein